MTIIQALLLGIIQGVTEFFPMSSSAHLHLAQEFLQIPNGKNLLYFDLCCHSGTLCALLIYFRRDLLALLQQKQSYILSMIALSPLVIAYPIIHPLLTMSSSHPGYFLLCTASVLFCACSAKEPLFASHAHVQALMKQSIKYRDVLCIGVMQAIALFPGISRSALTISAARLLGWNWVDAARFSFLLAIPTILGGQIVETYALLHKAPVGDTTISTSCYAVAFITSLLMGLLGIKWMFRLYQRGNVRPFAWYCLAMGLFTIWMNRHG